MRTTAPQLLNKACSIMEQRAAQYDQPAGERSMAATVAAFNAVTGRDLTEADGWLMMVLLKLVRDNSRAAHEDSLLDAAAYVGLYGEARMAAMPAEAPKRPSEAFSGSAVATDAPAAFGTSERLYKAQTPFGAALPASIRK